MLTPNNYNNYQYSPIIKSEIYQPMLTPNNYNNYNNCQYLPILKSEIYQPIGNAHFTPNNYNK